VIKHSALHLHNGRHSRRIYITRAWCIYLYILYKHTNYCTVQRCHVHAGHSSLGGCVFGRYNMQIVRLLKKKLLPINRRDRLYNIYIEYIHAYTRPNATLHFHRVNKAASPRGGGGNGGPEGLKKQIISRSTRDKSCCSRNIIRPASPRDYRDDCRRSRSNTTTRGGLTGAGGVRSWDII